MEVLKNILCLYCHYWASRILDIKLLKDFNLGLERL